MEHSLSTSSAETEFLSGDSTAVNSRTETPTSCSSSDNLAAVENAQEKIMATSEDETKSSEQLDHSSSSSNDKNSTTPASTPKKVKPKVLKIEQQGIFTIKTLESSNFLKEWFKGFQKSMPSIICLL